MASELNNSVASVTVAYNASKIVRRHLDSLLNQSRPLQEIVIVDNASTDDTSAIVKEHYPSVTVLTMPENLGMAGGWAAGLSYAAVNRRHNWVWTFDDDSVPPAGGLEALLCGIREFTGSSVKIGMLAPLPIHRKTGTYYPPLLWRNGYVRPERNLMHRPFWCADLVIASGCLVRRQLVEEIGLPRSDYFMDFFDFEYCLRARSRDYQIVVVSKCELEHEIGNARTVRFAGYRRVWPNHSPWREYYISRNMVYTVWRLYPDLAAKCFVLRHLLRHAGGVLVFGSKKLTALKMMARGFEDGRLANLGITVRPY